MQIMVRDAYAFGDDGEEEYDGPSKSEVKRQLLALQDLGKQLTAMPQETLSNLSLPDDVLREVQEFQRIKTFKAGNCSGRPTRTRSGRLSLTSRDRAPAWWRCSIAARNCATN